MFPSVVLLWLKPPSPRTICFQPSVPGSRRNFLAAVQHSLPVNESVAYVNTTAARHVDLCVYSLWFLS